jgi:hypothetical protein
MIVRDGLMLIKLSNDVFLTAILTAPALAQLPTETVPVANNPQIDYAGFARLTEELQSYRAERLITLDQFNNRAQQDETLILDTRSAASFARGHIKGAINLPFSDFTERKLAQLLGDNQRPILIYCNNNFRDNIFPVARKARPLALNIPTFINLYGYGYKNIYELNDVVLMNDPRVQWVASQQES